MEVVEMNDLEMDQRLFLLGNGRKKDDPSTGSTVSGWLMALI